MQYKTTEFARKLGITREALRYYEKAGLLSPTRSNENRYRCFSDADGFEILRIKNLQAHHIPLSEAGSLISTSELLPQHSQLTQIEAELQQRINVLSAQLERMRKHRTFLEEAMAGSPDILEMDTYGMYHLMLLGKGITDDEKTGPVAAEWIASMPFTEIGWRIQLPENDIPETGMLSAQIGLQAMPHCAFAQNLSMESPVEFSPPAHSVRMLVVTNDPFHLPADSLSPLRTYLREHAYHRFSDLWGHFCGCSSAGGKRQYHFTVRALVRRPSKIA